MKKMNFLKIACAAALSAACCFAAVGCSQTKSDSGDVSVSDTSEGVAATVNGTGNRREGRDFVHRKLPQHVES